MSEDRDENGRPKSWVGRKIWDALDRKYDKIQDADFEDDPIRWSHNEFRMHNQIERVVRTISLVLIILPAACSVVMFWTALSAFWSRTYWLVAYCAVMGTVMAALAVRSARERRKDLANLAGVRAEMTASFNEFKERNGWDDATP
jgi:hypothetical protein